MVAGGDRRIGARFVELLPAHQRDGAEIDVLEPRLVQALETARAAWPDLAVTDDDFLAHLAAHLPDDGDAASALDRVHAADLYLACGCARGDPRALACFESHHLAQVGRRWLPGHRLADFAEEVRQRLRIRLLVAADGAPPRIASYSGRGPLAAWVRMSATRLALNLRQSQRSPGQVDDVLDLRAPGHDPEIEYLKTRYADELRQALEDTLAALSSRTANVLRLHYQEGMAAHAIATMYQVSGRTVQRWLAEARRTILAETRRLLRTRLGINDSRLDSLIGLVRSRLDISIYRHLRPRADTP